MTRRKDKYRKATVTFRIGEDTDQKIESLRKNLIRSTAMRSLWGGSPVKATRSAMVEQAIADLWQRKSNEYEDSSICGYCKQPKNMQKQYNELDSLYIDLKDLYKSMKSADHGSKTKDSKEKKKDI